MLFVVVFPLKQYYRHTCPNSVNAVGHKVYIYGGEKLPRVACDPHFQVKTRLMSLVRRITIEKIFTRLL